MEPRQKTLVDMIGRHCQQPMVGVEVGVSKGDTSAVLLAVFRQLTLHMVDLWEGVDQISMRQQEARKSAAAKSVAFAANRGQIHHCSSLYASQMLPNNLDFVFIDADHSYKSVRDDSNAWYRKVQPGGLMLWHDYGPESTYPGVTKAVDEFCAKVGKKPNQETGRIGWIAKN